MFRSVEGSERAQQFDFVLPHEHIICDFSIGVTAANDVLIDESIQVEEVQSLLQHGQSLVVDVTPEDAGRAPLALHRISRKTGVPIVMGCGWYMEPYYPDFVREGTEDALAAYLVNEIDSGVITSAGPIYPGIIGEIGTAGKEMSKTEERVLRAAGYASLETGLAVTTHAFIYPVGVKQAEILLAIGVEPQRIIIGHCDTVPFGHYHYELLDMGVFLQLDGCGREHLLPVEKHAEMVTTLCNQGWSRNLLLSRDVCMRSDLKAFKGKGYDWIMAQYTSLLRDFGVAQADLDNMLKHNPCRAIAVRERPTL